LSSRLFECERNHLVNRFHQIDFQGVADFFRHFRQIFFVVLRHDNRINAEAVRCEQRFGEIPIIALSSSSTPESIERGRKVGFHDYVAKFDRQSLIAALKEQTADIIQAA